MSAIGDHAYDSLTSTMGRGTASFAASGGVLAGLAGTVDWPVVGTFFGVLEGAFWGAVFGVVDALALAWFARATRSPWAARATSGAIALLAAAAYAGVALGPRTPITLVFVPIAAFVGAALGPLIAFGVEFTPGTGITGALGRCIGWYLAGGAAVGAAAGAVTGLVIGIRTFLRTAGFAAVEGAVFGVVSGLLLGCLGATVSLAPRVRARR
ncbi:MAG: hypothetical protein QOF37_530 [Thermoleophilaceae bacterium]|jgi:hypothetical protein|nr:hypothetical protein [Thermoleophilaceae bacterium]